MRDYGRDEIIACIGEMAPESLAEPWDNCGLAIATRRERVSHVLACLDVTDAAVDEAVRVGADLIVSHHPLIFKPIARIAYGEGDGAKIIRLIEAGISVYSAHTNVDKAVGGLNDLVSGIVGLALGDAGRAGDKETSAADPAAPSLPSAPFLPSAPPALKPYRVGDLPMPCSIDELAALTASRLKLDSVAVSRPAGGDRPIRRLAVMCGSFGMETGDLADAKADAALCGEIGHHKALELSSMGMYSIAVGHFGSERFFPSLAEKWLKDRFPDLIVTRCGFDSPVFGVYHYSRGQ